MYRLAGRGPRRWRCATLLLALNLVVVAFPSLTPVSATAPTVTAGLGDSFLSAGGFVETTFRPSAIDALRAVAETSDNQTIVAGTAGGDFGMTTSRYTPAQTTADFGGTYDVINAIAVLSDNRSVVAAGAAGDNLALAKFNAYGALDQSFGAGGKVVVDFGGADDAAYGVVVQPSGAIVVAGGNSSSMRLLRYNANGTLDGSFGSGGGASTLQGGAARALVAQPDGKLLAVSADGTHFLVTRYFADGQLDTGFGSGGTAAATVGSGAVANAVALQPDGRIVAAGGRAGTVALARFTPGGVVDPTFGAAGVVLDNLGRSETAYGVAVLSNGSLVVVGEGDPHSGFHAVYTTLGTRDRQVGGPDWTVALRAVAVFPAENAGAWGTNALDNFYGYPLEPDGRLITNYDSTGTDFGNPVQAPHALATQADGKIVVMGESNGATALVRYNPDGTRDPAFGVGGLVRGDLLWNSTSLAVEANGRIVVLGVARKVQGTVTLVGFRPDGGIDTTFGGGGSVSVGFHTDTEPASGEAMVQLPDGKLLIGGSSPDERPFLARFTADGIPDAGFGDDGVILDAFPDSVAQAQGTTLNSLALQFDGKVLAIDSNGRLHRLDATGAPDPTFGEAGSIAADGAAQPRAMALQADGKILVGGGWSADEVEVTRYNHDGSVDVAWRSTFTNFDTPAFHGGGSTVASLTVLPDGKVVLAAARGGEVAVARYLPDGALDPTFYDGGKLVDERGGEDEAGAVVVAGNQLLVAAEAGFRQRFTGFMFSRFFLGTTAAPTNVAATPGKGEATVTWSPAVTEAGNPVVSYTATSSDGVHRATTADATARSINVTGLPNGAPYRFTVRANVAGGAGPESAPSTVVVPVDTPGALYHSVASARILDTRIGLGAPTAPVGPGGTLALQVTGQGGVPASGVSAVMMNVTVTGPTAASYLTAWPSGEALPPTANLTYVAGQTVPNLVVVKVGADGKVDLRNNSGSTDVVADVSGWYGTDTETAGTRYTPLTPARILDTRIGLGAPTAPVGPGGILDLQVTGQGGVPATGVSAVVMNVTVTGPSAASYLTAWPYGWGLAPTANLTYVAGQTVPNLVVVKVSADGKVSLRNNSGATDVVADVSGWYGIDYAEAGSRYTPLTPARIVDTRIGLGAPTAPVGPGGTLAVQVTGRGGVPATGVSAVVMNVTVTGPTAASYLTAWPSGEALPPTANLTYVAGQTVPNLVVVKVGADGKVDLRNNSGSTDVVADVFGWYVSG